MKKRLLFLMVLLAMMIRPTSLAHGRSQEPGLSPLLTAVGGGYEQAPRIFLQAALARRPAGEIKILILPAAYASNAMTIAPDERSRNLVDAENRRAEFLQACEELTRAQSRTCRVDLAQVFTRADVEKIPVPLYFPDDLSGVFILGGDQAVAMQVLAGTLLEEALQSAYERGAVIGGTSAGTAVLSRTMLGGYRDGFSEAGSLEFGAVDLWTSTEATPERRGLTFGLQSAILDQHFFQRGRFGRLLNAVSTVEGPHLGIGVDADTAAIIQGSVIHAAGNTSLAVLDAETFHAADSSRYAGANRVLGLRNTLVHLLPPGNFEYSLETRQHSLQAPWKRIKRSFDALTLPQGAGNLYLGGGLKEHLEGNPALNAFVNDSGGAQAKILIVATGFSNRGAAQREAERYSTALQVASRTKVQMPTDRPLKIDINETTGVVVLGQDASLIHAEPLREVVRAWRSGMPVLADQAGVSVLGEYFAGLGATPVDDDEMAKPFTQDSFVQGGVQIRQGLGMLNISLEPELLTNNRWGRLFSLAYEHPANLAIGLTAGTTLVLSQDAAQVWGENGVVVLDLSHASLALGSNRAYAVANGLIDVFAPGEILRPTAADQAFAPARAATPVVSPITLPTSTQTPIVPTAAANPALILPPTSTPANTPAVVETREVETLDSQEIPPPTDQRLLHFMIVLGTIAILVILFGIWINRQRFNPR